MSNNFIVQAVRTALSAILILAMVLALLASQTVWARAEEPQNGQTERQVKAHEIAEAARELGLPEDNPIIQEASRIWWEEENNKVPLVRVPVDGIKFVEASSSPKMTYIGQLYVTGYSPYCSHCVGKTHPDGITASGTAAEIGRTVAMCSDYPFGTNIYIEGLGKYVVEDRGVGTGCVDVACEDHAACYKITGYYNVYVIKEG